MRRHLRLPVLCLIGLAAVPVLAVKDDKPRAVRGQLVVVGGGKPVESIYRRALELAGGPGARVVVVPQASQYVEFSGQKCVDYWKGIGAERVEAVYDLSDATAAAAMLESADLIWFCGGSQTRLMESLTGSGLHEVVRKRYEDGAVVCGTSAGAAVMSRRMILGPAGPRGTPEARYAAVGDGLGLFPDAVIDQHFLKRKRQDRLRRVVLENPALLGVGIDEGTAIVVSGRRFEVVGDSQVVVFDARTLAGVGAVPVVGLPVGTEDRPLDSLTLSPGQRFDLDEGLLAETSGATGN